MQVIYPQLDGVKINENRTLPFAVLQAIRKAYDYIAQLGTTSTTQAVVIEDTHANRETLHPAANLAIGSWYIETDRTEALYVVQEVSAAKQWVLVHGAMLGLLAARPADLTTNDVGFFYTATNALDYRWSGSAWVTMDTVRGGGNLTNVGALPKVSAAGTLTESAFWDTGTVAYLLARNFGVGTTSPGIQTTAGRSYVTIKGSSLGGVTEYATAQADADGNVVGVIQWSDGNSTAGDKRVSAVFGELQGATGNDRGGRLRFLTKANGGGLAEWARLDNAGNFGFGGNTAPAYAVDATGTVNASGAYRINGTLGLTQVVALAKLTGVGANGSATFVGGILTAYTAPT